MALTPFDGELDAPVSGLVPFSGKLDNDIGPDPVGQDNPLTRGWNKMIQGVGITKSLATGNYDETAQKIGEAARYQAANPGSKEGNELMAAWQRGNENPVENESAMEQIARTARNTKTGAVNLAGEFAKDWREAPGAISGIRETAKNVGAMGAGVVEQLPNMLLPMGGMLAGGAAGSAAGGPIGGIGGAWAGASAGNALVEGGGLAQEALHKAGINPNDPAAVKAYLEKNGDALLKQAAIKGGIIGAVDTATMGIAGKLLTAPGKAAAGRAMVDMGVDVANNDAVKAAMKSPELAARVAADPAYRAATTGVQGAARNVGAAALEPAGEFTGELVGQGVATGEWDVQNAALEAASSIGQSGATFAGQKAYAGLKYPFKANEDQVAQLPDTGPMSRSANTAIATGAAADAASVLGVPADAEQAVNVGIESGATSLTPQPIQQPVTQGAEAQFQRLAELELAAEQRQLTPAENAEAIQIQSALEQQGGEQPNVAPNADVAAQGEVAPNPFMAGRTEQQLNNLSGPGHTTKTRQAATAELERRATSLPQQTSTTPLQQTATRLDMPAPIAAPVQNIATNPVTNVQAGAGQSAGAGIPVSPVSPVSPQFDVSQRNPDQLAYLASNGKPGWKEAAAARLQSLGLPVPAVQANAAVDTVSKPKTSTVTDRAKNISRLQKELEGATPMSRRESGVIGRLITAVTDDAVKSIEAGSPPAYTAGNGSFIVIHPSAQKDGMVQVTRYNENGVFGDSQYNNIEDAIRDNSVWMKRRMSDDEATTALDNSAKAEAEYQKRREEPKADVAPATPEAQKADNRAKLEKARAKNVGPQSRDDLVGAILRVTGGKGIHPKMAQTIVGDKANAATKVRGLFTLRGQEDLDDIADLLRVQENYDVRDGNHLAELVREQAAGNPVYSMERNEREAAENEVRKYRDEIRSRAAALGIKTVAIKFDNIERAVLEAEAKQAQNEAAAERDAIQAEEAVSELDDDQINALLDLATQENKENGRYINEQWISNDEILDAFDGTETLEEPEDAQGAARAGEADAGDAGGNRQGRGDEAGFDLAAQTNTQAAEQFAQQTAEQTSPTKAQADLERDAVPFSLGMQSQPKPQGVQTGMFTADGRASADAQQKPAEPVAQPKQERGEVGASLTKEQRKSVLKTLVDVYRQKNAPRESKGVDSNGNERSGYAHSPELFEKSDITGAMVRYYVTLPDGRISHPTELFADYTQADIDAAMQKEIDANRQEEYGIKQAVDTANERGANSLNEARLVAIKRNWKPGENFQTAIVLQKDGRYHLTLGSTTEKTLAALGSDGWKNIGTFPEVRRAQDAQPKAEPAAQPKREGSQEWVDKDKTPDQLRADKVDSLAVELAGQITEESHQSDFAPSEMPIIVRAWADDARVPADELRQALLKSLARFDISEGRMAQIRRALDPTNKPAAQPKAEPAKYTGPADVSSRAGQMELANRGGRIATLKMMNEQLRKIAPDEAWADANIEQATDLDALQDSISKALVDAQRGKPEVNPLRKELEELSGQELKAVFDKMGLAGKLMGYEERISALLMEDAAEVRAAIKSVAEPAKAQEPAAKEPWQMTRSEFDSWPRPFQHGMASKYGIKRNVRERSAEQEKIRNKLALTPGGRGGDVAPDEFFAEGRDLHREVIEKALSEGKPVPANVLADYPDLKPATVNAKKEANQQADLSIRQDDMFTQFLPNTPEGEKAWRTMAVDTDGTGKVLNQHADSVIAQLRAAGYTVDKEKSVKMDDDALLDELSLPKEAYPADGDTGIRYSKVSDAPAGLTKSDLIPQIAKSLGSQSLARVLVESGLVTGVHGQAALDRIVEANSGARYMVAWHGSPHDHDKFDSSKIGTGEGAQAYGYGLYFAGAKDVAEHYRKGLSRKDFINKAREAYNEFDDPNDAAAELIENGGLSDAQKELVSALQEDDWLGFDYPHQAVQAAFREPENFKLSDRTKAAIAAQGRLYQVELAPSEDEYLDWDKPLSEQSALVQELINKAGMYDDLSKAGGNVYLNVTEYIARKSGHRLARTLRKHQQAASDYLRSIGIRGIRYLDGSSRGVPNHVFSAGGVTVTANLQKDSVAKLIEGLVSAGFDKKTASAAVGYLSDSRNTQDPLAEALFGADIDLKRGAIDSGVIDAIRAISYRGTNANSNYVIFSDDDVTITAKYAKENGGILGATLPDGRIVLNLENLNADNFAGVFQHEGFHSTIRELVGEQTYTQMMKRLENMGATGNARQWFKDAEAAIPSNTKAENRTEELAAYAVEQYTNGTKQPNVIKQWVESLLSALRTAIIRRLPFGKLKTWAVNNLQPQDLARLAIAGLKAKAQGQLQAQGREAMAYSRNEGVQSSYGLPNEQLGNRAFDRAEIRALRRLAASMERPEAGITFRITDDGIAIATGPKGTRVPERYIRFANDNGLSFESRRLPISGGTEAPAMPAIYRTDGALYFGEMASNARPIDRTGKTRFSKINQTDTPEFKAWFGDSKVVDADGKPLVVYHGTPTGGFSKFDPNKIGKRGTFESARAGFYFSDQQQYAGVMAVTRDGSGNTIYPVYLSIKNPLRVFTTELTESSEVSEMIAAAKAGKHDGIIDEMGNYVAFSPTQIKSAIGNNGQFDPTNPDIRYSKSAASGNPPSQPPAQPPNQWQSAKQKFANLTSPDSINKLVYNFQNKFIDLKNVRDRIKQIGGTLTDMNDAYLGEEMYHGKVMKKTGDFLDSELRPLLQQLLNNGIKKEEFETFLHARHAPEANKVLAERNPTQAMIDSGKQAAETSLKALQVQLQKAQAQGSATKAIEQAIEKAQAEKGKWSGAQAFRGTEDERLSLSGMSDAEAAQFMATLSAGQRKDMNAAAAKVDSIQARTLAELEKYGLMDKTSLDAWRKEYQHYVPLHRDEAHPDSASHPIGQGFSVKGDASKRRTGSNEKVTNILGHIAMQREAAITRGEKNSVSKRLYLLAAQNPDKDFWSTDRPPMLKTIDQRTGFVRTQIDPMYKNKPNVLMVRIAGNDAAIVFNEHNPEAVRLAGALKNLDGQDLDIVERTIGKATRWFAAVNTQYNPIFGVINLLRDSQSGILNLTSTALGDKKGAVAKGIPSALKAIYQAERGITPSNAGMAALWREFQTVGGQTGYRDLFASPEDRGKALEKELKTLERGPLSQRLHAMADWLSDYNTVMENGVRLSAYKVALDQGMSKERAASLAKNLTVNFNRKGAKAAKLGAFYAFFNASVQGTERLANTMTGPAGRKILMGGIALGVLQQALGMMMMGGDDDEWEKIPDFVKERSLIFPMGGGYFVSIPMPLGFNVLPNIGRLFAEWAMGGKDKPTGAQIGKLMNVVLSSFNPVGGNDLVDTISPTVSDPVVSLLRNKDWTGRPIYREDMASLDPTPGFTRTKDSATPWAKGMSYVVNMATGGTDYTPGRWSPTPDQIDYVIGQITGGVGRELGKAAQTGAALTGLSNDELPIHKVPLAGRLLGSTAGTSGQSGRFYENIRELNGVEREIKGRVMDGKDIAAYVDSEPLAGLVGYGNGAERQVKMLRERRRMLSNEGDSAGAKEIDGMISETMKGLNTEMRSARR